MANALYDRLFAGLKGDEGDLLVLADGQSWSRARFHDTLAQLAGALRGLGVVPGDRVAVQVAKSPEALALYAATVSIGAVFLPLNTAYTRQELAYFLDNAAPRVLVCDPAVAGELADLVRQAAAALVTLGPGAEGSLMQRAAGEARDLAVADCPPEALAAILYTSGTTGRSKGAMLSHGNLLSNALTLADLWRFGPQDVLLHALPIFHTHGLFVASNTVLASGGRMIFHPGFALDQVLDALPRATVMMGVPTFYTRLLETPRLTRALVAGMRLFISGSAPLLAETHARWAERTGHRILERYGMTETNMNTSNPYDGERRAGTVGFPLPGVELRIMAGDAEVAPGEAGVIQVRGPNVFLGYWQMPEKTAEELRADGWFITGDIGRVDADGYVQIVGRAKDMVITGGFNVYPIEIEALLDEQPGVLESAVIGVPHPDFGEAVLAVLVARGDVPLDPEAALGGLQGRLARFKQPKAAVVVPALPRNTMGKVQKAELRRTYAARFGAATPAGMAGPGPAPGQGQGQS